MKATEKELKIEKIESIIKDLEEALENAKEEKSTFVELIAEYNSKLDDIKKQL